MQYILFTNVGHFVTYLSSKEMCIKTLFWYESVRTLIKILETNKCDILDISLLWSKPFDELMNHNTFNYYFISSYSISRLNQIVINSINCQMTLFYSYQKNVENNSCMKFKLKFTCTSTNIVMNNTKIDSNPQIRWLIPLSR